MTTPFSCPECGSPLELHDDAETETMTWRCRPGTMPHMETSLRPAIVAFCVACEFAIEVGKCGCGGPVNHKGPCEN